MKQIELTMINDEEEQVKTTFVNPEQYFISYWDNGGGNTALLLADAARTIVVICEPYHQFKQKMKEF